MIHCGSRGLATRSAPTGPAPSRGWPRRPLRLQGRRPGRGHLPTGRPGLPASPACPIGVLKAEHQPTQQTAPRQVIVARGASRSGHAAARPEVSGSHLRPERPGRTPHKCGMDDRCAAVHPYQPGRAEPRDRTWSPIGPFGPPSARTPDDSVESSYRPLATPPCAPGQPDHVAVRIRQRERPISPTGIRGLTVLLPSASARSR
jgi:hypothetical protein